MYQFIMAIHVFAAVSLIFLVLVQQGKGATAGAAFGSGASQTVFGSRGSGSFLLRVTLAFVAIFFVTSITLNYMATKAQKREAQALMPIPTAPRGTVLPPTSVSPNSIPATTSRPLPTTKPAVGEKQVENRKTQ